MVKIQRRGLFGIIEMLVNDGSEKFLKDDGRTSDIEVAAEKTFLVRGSDLVCESLVRHAVEESLPMLELDIVDMGDKLPDIDLLYAQVCSITSLKAGNDRMRP
ncbi:hypothetical protein [Nitrobacter sp. TKz-YC02]|uniref:hypothetical protein n=1 Tax=Nitrobacter sp. TKz-YC02 TaxID=3398704 RepID=UPI003CF295FA